MTDGRSPEALDEWSATLDQIEATLDSMSGDDRNDAIEALRSRFDEIYTRDNETTSDTCDGCGSDTPRDDVTAVLGPDGGVFCPKCLPTG